MLPHHCALETFRRQCYLSSHSKAVQLLFGQSQANESHTEIILIQTRPESGTIAQWCHQQVPQFKDLSSVQCHSRRNDTVNPCSSNATSLSSLHSDNRLADHTKQKPNPIAPAKGRDLRHGVSKASQPASMELCSISCLDYRRGQIN
jgi:hypothetical protein